MMESFASAASAITASIDSLRTISFWKRIGLMSRKKFGHYLRNVDDEPPLSVTRIAREPGRYRVRSQRRGIGHHVVEMDNPAWPQGYCQCEDFTIRIEFPLKNDLEPERLTCVHINSVNATIEHGRALCEAAGLPFNLNIIPEL